MTTIEAILSAVALICSTALVIRLSTASVTRGRIWLLLLIAFMLRMVAKWGGVMP